jgi:biopolymer transport protein ExbB
MMIKPVNGIMRQLTGVMAACVVLLSPVYATAVETGTVQATAPAAVASLDELLEKVRQHQSDEKALYAQREQRFLQQRDQQQQLLAEARARFLDMQSRNNPLQQKADTNAALIASMRAELDSHVHDLGDIYSIYNEFAGDFIARMGDSLVQTGFPERHAQLQALRTENRLPGIDDMRALWLLLQQEMTEAGKIRRYPAQVIQPDGSKKTQNISRIGTFSVAADAQLLRYIPESGELMALERQPSGVAGALQAFDKGSAGASQLLPVVIDPTRGSLLGLLGQSPTLRERIAQGQEVGYTILGLGAAGLLLALYRLIYLLVVWQKTRRQLRNIGQPSNNNPLGRVLQQASVLAGTDEQTLQLHLDEAILQELPKLEQGLGLIKLLASIATLMGLLGTVVGMIETFQTISLFGSGDPKLMASGISQALVTTVEGLVVAIPLLFCHNIVGSFSRSLVQLLDEQSAGILARHLESTAVMESAAIKKRQEINNA